MITSVIESGFITKEKECKKRSLLASFQSNIKEIS